MGPVCAFRITGASACAPTWAAPRRPHRGASGQTHRPREAHGDDGGTKLHGRTRPLLVETTDLFWRVLVHRADRRDADMAPWLFATAYETCERWPHVWA